MKKKVEKINPLSPTQEGMLFYSLLNEEGKNYYVQVCFYLIGKVQENFLRQSWEKLVNTHEILRSDFIWKQSKVPVQIVLEEKEPEIYTYDISHLGGQEQEKYIAEFTRNDLDKKLDFTTNQLNRLSLLRLSPEKYLMCWTFHHILLDGWSMPIIIREFLDTYHALANNEPLPAGAKAQFSDYLNWLQKKNKKQGITFWKEYLARLLEPTYLRGDLTGGSDGKASDNWSGSPGSTDREGGGKDVIQQSETVYLTLDAVKTGQIDAFCKKNRITTNALFQTAWGLLLQKLHNTDISCFGMTTAGRSIEIKNVESIVGLMINTIPVIVQRARDETIAELLEKINENLAEIRDYEYISLAEVQKASQIGIGRELFNSILVFENYPLESVGALANEEITLEFASEFELTNYDMTVVITSNETTLIKFSYNSNLYSSELVARIQKWWMNILNAMLVNETATLDVIDYLTLEEKQALLYDWNQTETDYPRDKTIYQIFEEQVELTPDASALQFGQLEITYRELNAKANQLARVLREKGVGPDTIVGIMAERSPEMIMGILAVLKAGGAYLPIDPQYPKERINYMLEDSKTAILLTMPSVAGVLGDIGGASDVTRHGNVASRQDGGKKENAVTSEDDVDSKTTAVMQSGVEGENGALFVFNGEILNLQDAGLFTGDTTNLECINQVTDLVYIIYTSGSTGKPKGAMIEHRGLVNYITWAKKVYLQGEAGAFPLYSSLSFDLTVTSIYVPLTSGNRIVIYGHEDNEILIEKIVKDNLVDIIKLTPAHLRVLKDTDVTNSRIRRMIVGGEDLKTELARKIYQKFNGKVEIYNEYGPTETVVGCMIYCYNPEQDVRASVPIGVPADNTQIYLLDKHLQPVAQGVPGEMFISGDGVGRGYLNRRELTAERFLANPFVAGKRMYKTGDLAQILPNGQMEFLSRVDFQVKIRGFRIELGEIESQILTHPTIQDAAVSDRTDSLGNKTLCAYMVLKSSNNEVSNSALSQVDLRAYLGTRLPDYMIPSYFVTMEKLPLTQNGKLDRKALPDPTEHIGASTQYIAPASEAETKMTAIWGEVLGVKQVGVMDNFFELGGDSIKAIQILARSTQQGINITVKDIFKYKTIADILSNVDYTREKELTFQGEVEGKVLLTPIEQWFFEQNFTYPSYWNQTSIFRLRDDVDYELLEKVFIKVLEHHDALRMQFIVEGGQVQQQNRRMDQVTFKLERIDLSQYSPDEQEAKIRDISDEIQKQLDLERDLLLKGIILDLGLKGKRLLVPVHHLVIDGVSWRILLEDLETLYQSKMQTELPAKSTSFKAWSYELQKYARSEFVDLEYWEAIEPAKFVSLLAWKASEHYHLAKASGKSESSLATQCAVSAEDGKVAQDAVSAEDGKVAQDAVSAQDVRCYRNFRRLRLTLSGRNEESVD